VSTSIALSTRLRFCVHLAAGLPVIACGIGCRSRTQNAATNESTTRTSPIRDSVDRLNDADLYFGVSRDRIAWFVYLNRLTRSGVLYEPLGTVNLCEVRLGPGDTLFFRSALGGGAYYTFEGRVGQDFLDGVIWMQRQRSRTPADSFRVLLGLLPLPPPTTGPSKSLSGLYSDVWYHEGAGDLLGQEVLLLETGSSMRAVTILYGGGPGWPTAADSVVRSGDTLAIWQREPFHRGPPPDAAVLRGDTLSFFDGGPQLPRKHSLRDVFTGAPRFRCP